MKKIAFLPVDYVDREAFSASALRWALPDVWKTALTRFGGFFIVPGSPDAPSAPGRHAPSQSPR